MSCRTCLQPSHLSCNGTETEYELVQNPGGLCYMIYSCDRCLHQAKGCFYCGLATGAMKHLDTGQQAHLVCAIYN